MISDFDAGFKFFVCGPVGKKVKAVIYTRTYERGSEHECDYVHFVEGCQGCNYGNSKRD